jgi:excisionase family DNA binding protein
LGRSSRTTVYKLVDEGQLDLVKIGRRSFITAESLERYVAWLAYGSPDDDSRLAEVPSRD